MATLVWDQVGDRVYENGVDKGVLYLPDGSGVAWNGLTQVQQTFEQKVEGIYYDGAKINDLVTLGSFAATMKAVTYPDEFVDLEGMQEYKRGMYLADQPLKTFGLCYRTMIGDDLTHGKNAYKLHLVYNLTAIPKDSTFTSISSDPQLVEFEWDLTAVPNDIPGYRPTAHTVMDSREMDPWLLDEIEDILYGSAEGDAVLIPIDDLIEYVEGWYRLKIIDNGDGTWTAIEHTDGANIIFLGMEEFKIVECNAIYLDNVTFLLGDTLDVTDVPTIKIFNNGDGTWTAQSSPDALIEVLPDGFFSIFNANATYFDQYTYQITDTYVDTP